VTWPDRRNEALASYVKRRSKATDKRTVGIPLDELLAAHASGDDARLAALMERHGRSLVPTSAIATKPSTASKRRKVASNKARGTRFARSDDSQTVENASPRLVGYARVSTDEQTTRLQRDALRAAGVEVVFEDKESGALRSRPRLDRALAELRAGDTLVVWKLDGLGRSLRNLLEVAETPRERGVALRSLTEHIDTASAAGKMLYAVLGAVAQFERTCYASAPSPRCAPPRTAENTSVARRRSRPRRFTKRARCSSAARVHRTSRAFCASGGRRSTAQSIECDTSVMTPVNVRFTPDAAELTRIQTAFSKVQPRLPMGLAVMLAAMYLFLGGLNLTLHRPGFWQIGYVQILLGICYIPITWRLQSAYLLRAKPSSEINLTIDDTGILVESPIMRIPWKRVSAIRDVGEAFVILRTYGKPVPILKRALPDRGAELWTALEAKLTSMRYLVRGSEARLTITNTAAKH